MIRAEGGEEALERTRKWRPHLVLCDVTLADGENGLVVVDRLQHQHGPGLACAFITGETAPDLILPSVLANIRFCSSRRNPPSYAH